MRHLAAGGWAAVGTTHKKSPGPEQADFVYANVESFQQLRSLLRKVSPGYVFHLAAITNPRHPRVFRTNVGGVVALLEAVKEASPLARVLVVGSDAQYGPQETLPTPESAPMHPINRYGRSKVLQETLALQYARMAGLWIVCVRTFNYIGPGQLGGSLAANIARQIASAERGGSPEIRVGDLTTWRDYTDVRDIVRAYFLALECGQPGVVYNVGSGVSYSGQQLANLLSSRARTAVSFKRDPALVRVNDVAETRCDATLIRQTAGWTPCYSIEQTVEATLDYWRQELATESAMN